MVRDRHAADGLAPLGNELLGELATGALSGTVATAGDGWVHGHAGDPFQSVRLEAHDAPPPVVPDGWEDVVESPFHSRSGRVALGFLTGGEHDGTLELGRRGLFRVRIARRAAAAGEEGDVWLVQFWPSAAPGLPRWVRRTRPALFAPGAGWQQVLGYGVMSAAWTAAGYGPPRPDSWLDEPLQGAPPDAAICAQLGVERPVTQRDAVTLLVAAGVLVADGDAHRLADHPPLAADRLSLPEDLAAQLERAAASARYTWVAADLTSVAAWGDPAPADDLAERLLIAPDDVPGLLAYAVADRLVQRVGEGIAALPRRQPEPVSRPVPVVVPSRAAHPATIPGAPPRAGVVGGNGDVILWRAGEPVVLGHVPDRYRYRAHETTAGITVSTSGGPGTLVRWDGTTERLPVDLGVNPVRSADGRFLAGVEHHVGRRSWDRPHLLDVTTGEVASLPRTDELTRRALAVVDGELLLHRWQSGRRPHFPLAPGGRPRATAARSLAGRSALGRGARTRHRRRLPPPPGRHPDPGARRSAVRARPGR